MEKSLSRAVEAAGGVVALARALGIRHPSILQWTRVPPLRVLAVEKITGISRSELRPDIYPPPDIVPQPEGEHNAGNH